MIEDFFTNEELLFVMKDVESMVDGLAGKLKSEGKIKETYENEAPSSRLTLIEKECPGSAVVLHTMAARMVPIHYCSNIINLQHYFKLNIIIFNKLYPSYIAYNHVILIVNNQF